MASTAEIKRRFDRLPQCAHPRPPIVRVNPHTGTPVPGAPPECPDCGQVLMFVWVSDAEEAQR